MNVSDIIRSLRCEPRAWKMGAETPMIVREGNLPDIYIYPTCHAFMCNRGYGLRAPNVVLTSTLDRLRLRWAVWRWKKSCLKQ